MDPALYVVAGAILPWRLGWVIFGKPYADTVHARRPADALLARRRLSLQTRPRRVGAGLAPRAGRDGSPDPGRRLEPRRRRRVPGGARSRDRGDGGFFHAAGGRSLRLPAHRRY